MMGKMTNIDIGLMVYFCLYLITFLIIKKLKSHHHFNFNSILMISVDSRRQKLNRGFNCDDDLSTYRGEVFVVDRNTVQTPYRILDIPTKKHTYGIFTDAFFFLQYKCNYKIDCM